jgi:hypothetical protein
MPKPVIDWEKVWKDVDRWFICADWAETRDKIESLITAQLAKKGRK